MKTRKRRVEFFSFYNHTDIERHFMKMAQKGWLIESISNLYWTYRKIEPQDLHFCVTYYPRGSDFDPEPSPEQQTFHDFCAHTGWKLACTWFQMQVFYNELGSPIPLETDPVMEVDTLHRACKKNFLPSYFVMLAVGALLGGYFLARIRYDPIGLLSDSTHLMTGFACLCLFALSAAELMTYYIWHAKAKKAAQDGLFMETPGTMKFQWVILVLLVIVWGGWMIDLFAGDDPLRGWISVVMFVYVFSVMLLVNGIKRGLKKAGASRGVNRTLTLAACVLIPVVLTSIMIYAGISANRSGVFSGNPDLRDEIPLSLTDFTEINEDQYIRQKRNKQTLRKGQRFVSQFPHWDVVDSHKLPNLQYTTTTVKVPVLYDWCMEQMFRDLDESLEEDVPLGHRHILREQDAAPWGAEKAYRTYNEEGWWLDWYLLCYPDKIVEIRFDWEPTAEQTALVGKKLNG